MGFYGKTCGACSCQEKDGVCNFNITGDGNCLRCYDKCKTGSTCADTKNSCKQSWVNRNAWIFGVIVAVLAIIFGGVWAQLHPEQTHQMLNVDSESLVQQ